MSELIAIGYADEHRAAEVMDALREPQQEHAIELEGHRHWMGPKAKHKDGRI